MRSDAHRPAARCQFRGPEIRRGNDALLVRTAVKIAASTANV
jgi:hypothetical protein